MIRNLFTALMAISFLGACATTVDTEKMAKIRTVGVISLIGQKLQWAHVRWVFSEGATDGLPVHPGYVVTYNISEHPFSDWQLDQTAVNIAQESLRRGGYKVVDVSYNPAAFEKIAERFFLGPALTEDPIIQYELRKIVASQRMDALIVIAPFETEDGSASVHPVSVMFNDIRMDFKRADTRVDLRGAGIFSKTMGKDVITVAQYMLARVYILDGETLKIIGQRVANKKRDLERPPISGYAYFEGNLYTKIDSSFFKDNFDFDKVSEREKKKLTDVFDEFLRQGVPFTLEQLGFAVAPLEAVKPR